MLSALGPGRVPVVPSPGELGGAAVPGLLQPCRGAPGSFLESHQNPSIVRAPGTGSWALPPLLLCERGLEMGIRGV